MRRYLLLPPLIAILLVSSLAFAPLCYAHDRPTIDDVLQAAPPCVQCEESALPASWRNPSTDDHLLDVAVLFSYRTALVQDDIAMRLARREAARTLGCLEPSAQRRTYRRPTGWAPRPDH